MKFVFINPRRTLETGNIWNAVNSVTIPLGLATLAAVLEQDGHAARIIDAEALELSGEQAVEAIEEDADFIGFTATTPEIDAIISMARLARARLPRARIVFGGVHPTVFASELVGDGCCDMVVRGEGEASVKALAGGAPLSEIPNLTWKDAQGKVIENPRSATFTDLYELPYPAYHLLPVGRYRSALGAARRTPSMGMITSRGCPGKCTFCFSGMFGEKIRMVPAGKVFEHIVFLKREFGIREISFYDDTFTTNRRRVEELCSLLMEGNTDISWSCFARVDSVSPDVLRLMKKAGCHQIMFGLESPDEEILKNINKRTTLNKAEQAVAWTRAAGIDVRGALMLGNPGETEQSMKRLIRYASKADMQFAIFNITTPFPGTAMYDWARESGYLKHRDWKLYDLSHAVMELPTVSGRKVEEYYRLAYREFYLRPSYMARRFFAMRTAHDVTTNARAFAGVVLTALKRRAGLA